MNIIQRLAVEHKLFGTIALSLGFVTEMTAFLIWFERLRPWVTTGLIMMHLGIGFTMNIHFTYNIYLLLLVGYPWGRGIDWLRANLTRQKIALRPL